MRSVLLGALVALAACGPSKPPYTFPGCDGAGSGSGGCSDTAVFFCAQRTIVQRFNACSASSDCVLVSPRTTCAGSCEVAVNAENAGAFRDQMANESARFCSASGCRQGGFDSPCMFARGAVCTDGRCQSSSLPDGG